MHTVNMQNRQMAQEGAETSNTQPLLHITSHHLLQFITLFPAELLSHYQAAAHDGITSEC